MDALMAAIVLGALCQIGDRTPWLAAIMADRFDNRPLVIAGAAFALAVNYAVGAISGMLLVPLLVPAARDLLLALALVFAGLGTSWRDRAPDRLAGWRIGAIATTTLGLAIMIAGDRMQFVAAALAARSPVPWLAAIGATLGALAVTIPAIMPGEARWLALPRRTASLIAAALMTVAGIVIALRAIALI